MSSGNDEELVKARQFIDTKIAEVKELQQALQVWEDENASAKEKLNAGSLLIENLTLFNGSLKYFELSDQYDSVTKKLQQFKDEADNYSFDVLSEEYANWYNNLNDSDRN